MAADCWMVLLFVWLTGLVFELIQCQESIDTLSKYSFEKDARFIKVFLSLPDTAFGVYGLIESSDSSVVFEMRYDLSGGVLSLPVDDVELSIANASSYCPASEAGDTFMNFEIEMEDTAVTVRSRNSEQYELATPLLPHEHFRLLFFLVAGEENCVLPAITTTSNTSAHHIPPSKHPFPLETQSLKPTTKRSRFNFKAKSTLRPMSRRATTLRSAYLRTTTIHSRVRFATFKHIAAKATTEAPHEVAYIDILKDKEHYEEVKRSMTNEINSHWSPVFIVLISLQIFLISSFTMFGLTMFILLQCKPSNLNKPVAAE